MSFSFCLTQFLQDKGLLCHPTISKHYWEIRALTQIGEMIHNQLNPSNPEEKNDTTIPLQQYDYVWLPHFYWLLSGWTLARLSPLFYTSTSSGRHYLGISGIDIYRLDVFPLTQPTVSKTHPSHRSDLSYSSSLLHSWGEEALVLLKWLAKVTTASEVK